MIEFAEYIKSNYDSIKITYKESAVKLQFLSSEDISYLLYDIASSLDTFFNKDTQIQIFYDDLEVWIQEI